MSQYLRLSSRSLQRSQSDVRLASGFVDGGTCWYYAFKAERRSSCIIKSRASESRPVSQLSLAERQRPIVLGILDSVCSAARVERSSQHAIYKRYAAVESRRASPPCSSSSVFIPSGYADLSRRQDACPAQQSVTCRRAHNPHARICNGEMASYMR
ncbi:uncharacterized protein LAESUDRAFT_720253 [Laetiporus sulphureus 93-53]|uniref:Uncharacterized protein n=1 Tax=Laetiporus sulphureus 93-53 TaxID=1314785 RepID=A0A165HX15_9APHY|nr:uncharacterized protein LAESUDRAFT_720253 [Laetiporus sulphureus 93-53]KZT12301.1 hypothetical protein LAESUDRAFT_720253 [Laetiporus sulphureus 93-53]